ncbi:MAG: DUF4328 domain-containing protein [Acidimicrobiia bacterium]
MQQAAEPWRRQATLERALAALLTLVAVVLLVRAVALGARLRALDDVGAEEFARRARDADSFVTVMSVISVVVILAIIPCFIVWCWRAAKNQEALGRQPERLGSGFAIGGWFIPLANLVMPVLVIQDLWRGSDARIERGDPRWRIADRSWLVGAWWGLFLVAAFTFAGSPADQRSFDLSQARGANLVALFGMIGGATSAVLAILVVRRLGARQEECRAAQRAAGAPFDQIGTRGSEP